jgi:hypothetical protein
VTVKEYFPADYAARVDDVDAVPRSRDCAADYKWGLERFIAEAQTLARFEHPNIVRVFDYFQENKTAYMVLQFEVGSSLRAWHKDLKRAPRQAEIDTLIAPLLDALELIHARDFLHRDIAPDNIIVRERLSPVLIDFGSARGEIANHSRTVSALVKPGYSPYGQYATTTSQQGPWTDIYALGATLYQLVTGQRPPDAPSRIVSDTYVPAREAAVGSFRQAFLSAIDSALALDPKDRPQTIADWRGPLLSPPEKPPGRLSGGLTFGLRKRPAPKPEPEVVAATAAASPARALQETPGPPAQALDVVSGARMPAPAAVDPVLAPRPQPANASAPVRHGLGYGPAPVLLPVATPRVTPPSAAAAATADATPAAMAEAVPVPVKPVPLKRKPESLGRRLWFFLRPPWRGWVMKLGAGIAIATLAVTYQDLLPAAWQPVPPAPVPPGRPAASVTPVSPPASAPAAPAPAPPARLVPDIKAAATLSGHRGPVLALGFQQSGRRIVTVGADQVIRSTDLDQPHTSRSVTLGGAGPAAGPATTPAAAAAPPPAPIVAASLLGAQAATAHADGTVIVWDVESGARIATTRRLDGAVTALSPTDDPERMIVAGPDGRIIMLDRRSGTPVVADEAHRDIVRAVTFVAGRNGILSASADRTIKAWNASSLDLRRTHVGHKDAVTALAAAPDGRVFASGDDAGEVRLWSAFASQSRRTLKAHTARVSALAYAPDAGLTASAAADGTVKLWDTRRGRELAGVQASMAAIRVLAFTSDGRRLVTAAEDGGVKLWELTGLRSARDER